MAIRVLCLLLLSSDCLATTISDLIIVIEPDGNHYTAQHTLFTEEELVVITLPKDRTTLNVEFGGPNSRVFARAHEQNPDRQSLWSGTVHSRFRHRIPDIGDETEPASQIRRVSTAGIQLTMANTEKLSYSVTWVLPESVELLSVSPDTSVESAAGGQWKRQANLLTFRQKGRLQKNLMIEYQLLDHQHKTPAQGADRCNESFTANDDCSPDTDSDGIPDYRDVCLPQSPGNTASTGSDAVEQPADLTSIDRLPLMNDPEKPAVGDALGCEHMPIVVLKDIEFESGKTYLSAKARQVLDRVAIAIQRNEGQLFEVAAHTDNAGRSENNQRLSENRANAIRHYLMLRGVGPNQLQARGYGESSPQHDNKLASGRAANRRVELRRLNP